MGIYNLQEFASGSHNRTSGAHLFVDIHILAAGEKSLIDVHCITDKIEQDLKAELPEADITVHTEPDE
jgi:divalent metal cation (Fe/Co/Zn/Cd) transporter